MKSLKVRRFGGNSIQDANGSEREIDSLCFLPGLLERKVLYFEFSKIITCTSLKDTHMYILQARTSQRSDKSVRDAREAQGAARHNSRNNHHDFDNNNETNYKNNNLNDKEAVRSNSSSSRSDANNDYHHYNSDTRSPARPKTLHLQQAGHYVAGDSSALPQIALNASALNGGKKSSPQALSRENSGLVGFVACLRLLFVGTLNLPVEWPVCVRVDKNT